MKKFIWNWKFKHSLFNKKEKVAFPALVLSLLIATISIPILLHEDKYELTFYDDKGNIVFVEEHANNTKLDLTYIFPEESSDNFYGWSDKPDKFNHIKSITVDGNRNFYAFNLTFDEEIENKDISFDTIKKEDSELIKDEEEIKQVGKQGTRQLKYKLYIVDGKIIKKKLIGDKILSNPTDEIVHVGIMVAEGTTENNLDSTNKDNNGSFEINTFVSGKSEPFVENEPSREKTAKQEVHQENNKSDEQNATSKNPGHNYVPIYGVGIIPNDYNDKFNNCSQLREVYPYGVPKGHPAYTNYPRGDRDGDGWACETKGSPDEFLN